MSSRLMRILLKLFPRRIRKRYGEELLDLQDELRTHGDLTRGAAIRDMLAGALLVRSARQRAALLTAAVLIAAGIAVAAGTMRVSTDSAAHAHRLPRQMTAVPLQSGSCFVAAGSSCSLTPCTLYIGRAAVADSSSGTKRRQPAAQGRCAANPRAHPTAPVFVDG